LLQAQTCTNDQLFTVKLNPKCDVEEWREKNIKSEIKLTVLCYFPGNISELSAAKNSGL